MSCNFLHGKLHAVQFSRYKARPLLSAADLYFSTPFRFCQGFLFPSPEGVTLFKSAPQALLPVLWMGGCLAVPLGSSSTSLPHPPAFVKTFFRPSRFSFGRAAGFSCQGARLFGNSLIRIPYTGISVNGFSGFFRSFSSFSPKGMEIGPSPPSIIHLGHLFYSSFIFRRRVPGGKG